MCDCDSDLIIHDSVYGDYLDCDERIPVNADLATQVYCCGDELLNSDFDPDTSEDYQSLGFGGVADVWSMVSCVTGPYAPVDYYNPPAIFTDPSSYRHTIGGLPSQMNLGSWQYELSFENDFHLRSYLYNGILNGFQIVDQNAVIESYCCPNYKSVLVQPCHSVIDDLIHKELKLGRYVIAESQPICVHALGAVPKRGGGFPSHYGLQAPPRFIDQ